MVEILTLGVDHLVMAVLYFIGSIILAEVFFERARLDIRNVLAHLLIVALSGILYKYYPRWQDVIGIFICAVLVNLFYNGSYKCKVWVFCVTQCIYFIICTLGWVMFNYIGVQFGLQFLKMKSLAGIWSMVISIGITKSFKGTFLYYKDKKVYESLSWGQSLFYAIVSVAIMLTANIGVGIYREGITFAGGDVKIALITYTALGGITVCYLRSCKRAKMECEREEAVLIENFSKKQLEAYKRLERLEKEGKIIGQEMEKRVVELMGLVDQETLAYVKPYVDEIQSQLIQESKYILTGNTVVDAIINEKYKLACEKHILISINISMPEKLSVDVGDLCLMIGNSIDYALEACEQITLGKGNKVKIQGVWQKGYILFRIWYSKAKNTELEEKLNNEESTKVAIQNDIYGLGAVAKCLEKYDGKLEFYTEGKWHKLEFYFNTIR